MLNWELLCVVLRKIFRGFDISIDKELRAEPIERVIVELNLRPLVLLLVHKHSECVWGIFHCDILQACPQAIRIISVRRWYLDLCFHVILVAVTRKDESTTPTFTPKCRPRTLDVAPSYRRPVIHSPCNNDWLRETGIFLLKLSQAQLFTTIYRHRRNCPRHTACVAAVDGEDCNVVRP